MLNLTRRQGQRIFIGDNIQVTVVDIRGQTVRIGISAPKEVRILRAKLEPHGDDDGDDGKNS